MSEWSGSEFTQLFFTMHARACGVVSAGIPEQSSQAVQGPVDAARFSRTFQGACRHLKERYPAIRFPAACPPRDGRELTVDEFVMGVRCIASAVLEVDPILSSEAPKRNPIHDWGHQVNVVIAAFLWSFDDGRFDQWYEHFDLEYRVAIAANPDTLPPGLAVRKV